MRGFAYDLAVITTFPDVVGGVIHAVGIRNGATRRPCARGTCRGAGRGARTDRRWRPVGHPEPRGVAPRVPDVRRRPDGVPSAAEALQWRLTKHGSILSINALGSTSATSSASGTRSRSRYSISALAGGTTVGTRPVRSGSRTSGRGDRGARRRRGGVRRRGRPGAAARRWCWRQAAETASGDATTEILVTVEGHHTGAAVDVRAAMGDLEALSGRTPYRLR